MATQIAPPILLMEEIPNNHLGCIKPVVNNGINYQPQLVTAGFQLSSQYHRVAIIWGTIQPLLHDTSSITFLSFGLHMSPRETSTNRSLFYDPPKNGHDKAKTSMNEDLSPIKKW